MPIDAETFLDRLACGFGRVILFLRENDAAPFREAVLDSCLHHRAFDQQTEDYRTEYLLDIMQATGEPEFYAAHIRQALSTDGQDYEYGQLYELAARLPRNGDEEARRVMYDRFARDASNQDTTGADDLVALDGVTGYLFVAEQWQRYPLSEEDHWEEAWLLEELERQIGQEEAREALRQAAEGRGLAAYIADVEQTKVRWHGWRDSRKPAPKPTYDEIAERIADPKQTARWPKWRSWARRLDDVTLARLAQDLLTETDRVPLLKRLHMFRERPFPLPIDRLLDLARDGMRTLPRRRAGLWAASPTRASPPWPWNSAWPTRRPPRRCTCCGTTSGRATTRGSSGWSPGTCLPRTSIRSASWPAS